MKIKESKETVKIKTGSLLMLVGRSIWRKIKNKRKIKTKEREKEKGKEGRFKRPTCKFENEF